jgi:putative membrane protein insertion efficiency factor
MGCCDSSAQLGSDRGIFGVGAGDVESDAAARRRAEASGAEAPEIGTRFTAELKPRPSGAGAESALSAGEGAVRNGGGAAGAGNSVDARNVLKIDDLRTMNSPTKRQGSAARWLLLLFVRFYQIFFSPFLGGACKFYPSCSRYAQEAIEMHGARRGAWLAMKRLGRCRPFTKGGFDPVPEIVDENGLDTELSRTNSNRQRGTSAAKAARHYGEGYVVAKATTHKATSRARVDYCDAEWLRTMGKERAQ